MRTIDQRRIKAQIDLATRITKGGEIDLEQAVRERTALADRVGAYRPEFLKWMKSQGLPRHEIEAELNALDALIIQLRTSPFAQQAIGGLGGLLG